MTKIQNIFIFSEIVSESQSNLPAAEKLSLRASQTPVSGQGAQPNLENQSSPTLNSQSHSYEQSRESNLNSCSPDKPALLSESCILERIDLISRSINILKALSMKFWCSFSERLIINALQTFTKMAWNFLIGKDLSLCQKLCFSNPFIFAIQCRRP